MRLLQILRDDAEHYLREGRDTPTRRLIAWIRPFLPSIILQYREARWIRQYQSERGWHHFRHDWRSRYATATDADWVEAYNDAWREVEKASVDDEDTELVARLIPDGVMKILDAGCGDGALAIALAHKGYKVTAVDCSDVAVHKGLEGSKSAGCETVEFLQGFVESAPFCDSSFDVVVCCHTLEHVKKIEKAVLSLRRLCKKAIIVIVPVQKSAPFGRDYHVRFFRDIEDLERAIGTRASSWYIYPKPHGTRNIIAKFDCSASPA